MSGLWLKDDTRNPSGSTKDRASLLVVAKAREYGCDTVATASTGNAATARAAPEAKLAQMLCYGAEVLPVEGSYDQAFDLCLEACEAFGWYNRNTALNPFTIEGKKTAALEIARQLAPDIPDAVLVPTGDGAIISGVAKGFTDLQRAGLMNRVPRLVAVQPDGSAGIVQALRSGLDMPAHVPDAHSVADSLTVQMPRNGLHSLKVIRASGGGGVIVSDDAIIEAIALLARTTGVFAEPAAAAALAGLLVALEEGMVMLSERTGGTARHGDRAQGCSDRHAFRNSAAAHCTPARGGRRAVGRLAEAREPLRVLRRRAGPVSRSVHRPDCLRTSRLRR
jgi:threonine synthase